MDLRQFLDPLSVHTPGFYIANLVTVDSTRIIRNVEVHAAVLLLEHDFFLLSIKVGG